MNRKPLEVRDFQLADPSPAAALLLREEPDEEEDEEDEKDGEDEDDEDDEDEDGNDGYSE
jgi:hypothetical protein